IPYAPNVWAKVWVSFVFLPRPTAQTGLSRSAHDESNRTPAGKTAPRLRYGTVNGTREQKGDRPMHTPRYRAARSPPPAGADPPPETLVPRRPGSAPTSTDRSPKTR